MWSTMKNASDDFDLGPPNVIWTLVENKNMKTMVKSATNCSYWSSKPTNLSREPHTVGVYMLLISFKFSLFTWKGKKMEENFLKLPNVNGQLLEVSVAIWTTDRTTRQTWKIPVILGGSPLDWMHCNGNQWLINLWSMNRGYPKRWSLAILKYLPHIDKPWVD